MPKPKTFQADTCKKHMFTQMRQNARSTFEVQDGERRGSRFQELGVVVDDQGPDPVREHGGHVSIHGGDGSRMFLTDGE
jgi:hypothetical protein